jgi:hypothetical protein
VPKAVYLSHGDVAFVGQQGADVTFDSQGAQRERTALAGIFRYLLAGLAALLLAILLVFWLRRRRTRAAARDAAEEATPTSRAA